MATFIALTQQQVDFAQNAPASVLVGELLSRPSSSAPFAELQHQRPIALNHTLADIKKSDLLNMNNVQLKEVYHAIATHLSLTNLPLEDTQTELLKKLIYPHVNRLGELKTHPNFSHLKAIIAPNIAGRRLVFVFHPQFLHSPANLTLPFKSDAKTVDDLNRLFANSRFNKELESLLDKGFMSIAKKSLSEFLTALSRLFLTKPILFSQAGLAEALGKSKGAWLLKHLPPCML